MVNFYGLCDGKIMVRKTMVFLAFCVEMLSFFSQNCGAPYLIGKS